MDFERVKSNLAKYLRNIVFTFFKKILNHTYQSYLITYRDLVHRQTSCAAIKHMSLGVHGFGCEDALTHLMNFVWPNVFETSPHLVQAFMDAVDGMRVSLGPVKVLSYVLQVRVYFYKILQSISLKHYK